VQADIAAEAVEQAEGAALAAACQRNRASALSSAIQSSRRPPMTAARTRPARRQNVAAVEDAPAVGRLHAAGQHVGRMWPLAAEQGDDAEHVARGLERAAHDAALERREGRAQFGGQRVGGVDGVAEIRREEQEALAQVALQGFGHQAQVAHLHGVGGRRDVGDLLQRQRAA
jgi:hypothetical protein